MKDESAILFWFMGSRRRSAEDLKPQRSSSWPRKAKTELCHCSFILETCSRYSATFLTRLCCELTLSLPLLPRFLLGQVVELIDQLVYLRFQIGCICRWVRRFDLQDGVHQANERALFFDRGEIATGKADIYKVLWIQWGSIIATVAAILKLF